MEFLNFSFIKVILFLVKKRPTILMIEFFYVFHYSSVLVYLVISKKCNVTRMSDSQDLPVSQQRGPGLEQSSEHVELKV